MLPPSLFIIVEDCKKIIRKIEETKEEEQKVEKEKEEDKEVDEEEKSNADGGRLLVLSSKQETSAERSNERRSREIGPSSASFAVTASS